MHGQSGGAADGNRRPAIALTPRAPFLLDVRHHGRIHRVPRSVDRRHTLDGDEDNAVSEQLILTPNKATWAEFPPFVLGIGICADDAELVMAHRDSVHRTPAIDGFVRDGASK